MPSLSRLCSPGIVFSPSSPYPRRLLSRVVPPRPKLTLPNLPCSSHLRFSCPSPAVWIAFGPYGSRKPRTTPEERRVINYIVLGGIIATGLIWNISRANRVSFLSLLSFAPRLDH